MALPGNMSLVWVRGTFLNLDGSAMTGRITFSANVIGGALVNPTAKRIIGASPFSGTLDANTGYFQVQLPATNDPDVTPVGFTYSVVEPTGRKYSITVPFDAPALDSPGDPLHGQQVIELSDIVPAPGASGGTAQLLRGRGVASMDVDGANHLVVTYSDDTTEDLGVLPGGALANMDDLDVTGAAVGQLVAVAQADPLTFRLADAAAAVDPAPFVETFAVEVVGGDLYSVSDLTGIRTQLTGGLTIADGPHQRGPGVLFTADSVEQWVPYRGGDPRPPAADLAKLAGWGSSTMANLASDMADIATERGATYYNGGVGSQIATQILARLGSRPFVLAADVTIPDSGDVNVTFSNTAATTATFSMPATIAGIAGTLAKASGSASPYVFTRTATGTATTVPAGTKVVSTDGAAQRQAITLLNIGKNDMVSAGAAPVVDVIDWTHQAFDWLGAIGRYALVIGHFVNTNTPAVDDARTRIDAYNAEMSRRYGGRYVDLQSYVTSAQVWTDTGITPTQTDLDQQALGNKPPSLSLDDAHLNVAGQTAVANLIGDRLNDLGWLTGLAPGTVIASDDFNRADSTNLGSTPVGGKAWTNTGQIAIASNQLSIAAVATTAKTATIDAGTPDVRVEATLAATGTNQGGGLIVRYVDDNNLYFLSIRQSNNIPGMRLFRIEGGTLTGVGSTYGTATAAGDVIAVESIGTTLIGYHNGVEVCRLEGATFNQAATRCGVYGHTAGTSVRWDDFSVKVA